MIYEIGVKQQLNTKLYQMSNLNFLELITET